ncbi:MAG: tyrosine-type recombinase/integrase, partial [Nitrospiria bacterium]
RHANLILKHFSGNRAAEITSDMIREYREKRRAHKVKDSTINRELAALKRMYRLGLEEDPPLVARIPKIPMVAENNVRTGFFDLGDFRELRANAPDHLKPVIAIAYYTGMRAGEILKLKWDQVDLVHGVLRLETGTTKNKEGREVPLIPELRQTLEWWRKETRGKYPFCRYVCHYKGERYGSYRRAWNTLCEKVGLTGAKMHDFRRTGVRNLIRAGVPQSVAMAISGHKTDSVFRRYDIVSHQDIQQAGDRLTRYFQERTAEADANIETDIDKAKVHAG